MLFQKQSPGVIWWRKRVLNDFTGKHLCWSLFFDKAVEWRPETLSKRDFNTGFFLCIFGNTFWRWVLDTFLFSVDESAKLRALRAKNVLTWQRVLRAYVLTYWRTLSVYVLTCQCDLVLRCSRTNVPCVLTCLRVNVPSSITLIHI